MLKLTITIFLLIGSILCPKPALAVGALPVTLLGNRPHNADLYTQGLFFANGFLYESSGLYGVSRIDKRPFPGGEPTASFILPGNFFAEGAALAGDEVYLLTWRENTVFVLDAETLALKRRHTYEGEGWGLAFDGERLWRSDGSANLYPHNPGDFSPAGNHVWVFDGKHPYPHLNELEWDPVNKVMLANVYGSDYVLVIDMPSGKPRTFLDTRPLRALAKKAAGDIDFFGAFNLDNALNGLALAPDGKSLWLTGKLWPAMYQIAWPPSGL